MAAAPTAPAPAGSGDRRAYFAALLKNVPKLEVRDVPGKGVGVFASKQIREGEVIFGEDPEGAFQWRTPPLACEHCMKVLGTQAFQLRLLEDPAARPCAGKTTDEEGLPGMEGNENVLSEEARKGWALWRSEAWFCSAACEDAHKSDFAGLAGQEERVRAFVEHAVCCRTPFFVLALKVLMRSGGLLPHLLQKPYWECVDLPEEDPEAHVQEMRKDLAESWCLLRKLDLKCLPKTEEDYARLVGSLCLNAVAVKYAHPLIYYMQEVDQGLGGAAAKQVLRPALQRARQERLRRAEAVRAAATADDDSGDGSDGAESESDLEDDEVNFSWSTDDGLPFDFSSRLFPPVKGYGLYPRLSSLNHSCDPGAEVVFPGNHHLLVVARRDVSEGEEVCISYIDHEEVDREERQNNLKSYGFVCKCRCCRPPRMKRKAGATPRRKKKKVRPAEP